MNELDLLLKILNGLEATTPTILSVIDMIKKGRQAGQTNAEIEAQSMTLALETRAITEQDMTNEP